MKHVAVAMVAELDVLHEMATTVVIQANADGGIADAFVGQVIGQAIAGLAGIAAVRVELSEHAPNLGVVGDAEADVPGSGSHAMRATGELAGRAELVAGQRVVRKRS